MGDFLNRHRKAIITFIALVVPLFLLFVHGRYPRKTTIIEQGLMQVTGPARAAASRVIHGIGDIWNGYIALVGVEEEKQALSQQVRELTAQALENKQLREENANLRAQLDFKRARKDLKLIAAHVIGKTVSPYARVLSIEVDLGAGDGIREGMPVVTEQGLVGRLQQVSGKYAEVMLVADQKSSVHVKVSAKGVTGTVEGLGLQDEYTARLMYLQRAIRPQPGDTVVTSGHDKIFPPGLEVGYIQKSEERQKGLYYELKVAPAVNFSVLETVQVVVGTIDGEVAAVPAPGAPAGPGGPARPGSPPPPGGP